MWESRLLLARFPRGSWKEWEDCLCLSTLSTAPSFPQLSPPLFFARQRLTLQSVAWPSASWFFLASSTR